MVNNYKYKNNKYLALQYFVLLNQNQVSCSKRQCFTWKRRHITQINIVVTLMQINYFVIRKAILIKKATKSSVTLFRKQLNFY